MNRGRTQGIGKKPEQHIPELIERIVEDVMATSTTPNEEWPDLWQSPFVPMVIPTPDRRHHQCTRVGTSAVDGAVEAPKEKDQ